VSHPGFDGDFAYTPTNGDIAKHSAARSAHNSATSSTRRNDPRCPPPKLRYGNLHSPRLPEFYAWLRQRAPSETRPRGSSIARADHHNRSIFASPGAHWRERILALLLETDAAAHLTEPFCHAENAGSKTVGPDSPARLRRSPTLVRSPCERLHSRSMEPRPQVFSAAQH
jgi:hypothetical protein